MKQSTIIWTVVLVLAGAFLIVRTSTGQMGRAYVIDEQVEPEDSNITWTISKDAAPNQTDTLGFRFSWSRTIGLWVAAFCTLAIFSFLYGDNPLYKLAEAVFVGSSAGYAMAIGFWDGIVTLLLKNLTPDLMRATFMPGIKPEEQANLLFLIPLALGIAMIWRLAPAGGWISRWALAFFIGATAGIRLLAYFESDFVAQIQSTVLPLIALAADGSFDWATSLKNITIVFGILVCTVYFFFSIEHKGAVGAAARVGIWFLMITFGAGFGYTVMGRIALLSGRLEFLYDDWLWLIDPLQKRIGM
jgi:hypothetical protein